ncbi:MAG: FliA/WhiG family RNA polymerase sigma factor [Ruminococcus sp.]|nr:FliA/WhiG family RNA polymerase sigma factor [Ruminococcus sp.]
MNSMYAAENMPADPAAEIAGLFEKYGRDKDNAVRNEIVMRSMHIVKYAVLSTRNMFRKYADEDDVYNEAALALMGAVDSFDPKRGVKFDTYASIKVRGAIIDYVRRSDIIPRNVRKFAKQYDRAYSELYEKLDREPTREEIAKFLGMSVEKLDSFAARNAAAQTVSFEEMILGGFDPADDSDDSCYEAERTVLEGERRQQLIEAIKTLKDKERTVISLYYYEKLKYSEIAQVMEVSESRVCQIHSKAVARLRDCLKEYML